MQEIQDKGHGWDNLSLKKKQLNQQGHRYGGSAGGSLGVPFFNISKDCQLLAAITLYLARLMKSRNHLSESLDAAPTAHCF